MRRKVGYEAFFCHIRNLYYCSLILVSGKCCPNKQFSMLNKYSRITDSGMLYFEFVIPWRKSSQGKNNNTHEDKFQWIFGYYLSSKN
jgi:hypothetical protein